MALTKFQESFLRIWEEEMKILKPTMKQELPKLLDRVKFGAMQAMIRREITAVPPEQLKKTLPEIKNVLEQLKNFDPAKINDTPEAKAYLDQYGITPERFKDILDKALNSSFFSTWINSIVKIIEGALADSEEEPQLRGESGDLPPAS